jgi:hypothetical protein
VSFDHVSIFIAKLVTKINELDDFGILGDNLANSTGILKWFQGNVVLAATCIAERTGYRDFSGLWSYMMYFPLVSIYQFHQGYSAVQTLP